jgi:hypothetical protein
MKGSFDMVVYKFYLRDPIRGDVFLSSLPERRKNPRRVTEESIEESIVHWGKTHFGKFANDGEIFFIKTVSEESEKRTPSFSPL